MAEPRRITYDQVLDELDADQLRSLCHHQGQQITRLASMNARAELEAHELREQLAFQTRRADEAVENLRRANAQRMKRRTA